MLSRRRFLGSAALGPASLRAAAGKPNIVLILADDLSWNACEPYGSREVRTPALARLAREGLCFDRMFTATAMCAPTRQQLFTGLYPVRNGAYPNHSRIYDGIRTMPALFQKLGYRTGLVGKEHFGPADAYPFERLGKRGIDPDPEALGPVAQFVQRDAAQPFLLVVASNQPHMPWDRGNPSDYPPEKLTVPPFLVDCPETRSALSRYYAEVSWFDRQVDGLMKMIDEAKARDNTLFLVTSEQGGQFPFSKWTCYDHGLRTAFIARWPGKVKPGTRTQAMAEYVDVLPTLLEAAGGAAPGGLDGKSFLPALLGRTDTHKRHVFGVHTTRGIIQGSECYPIRSVRTARWKYIRNLQTSPGFRNIVTEDAKGLIQTWTRLGGAAAERARAYIERPAEELYDLASDPDELRNVAGEARHAAVLKSLRVLLDEWMRGQGDEGVATEMKAKERQLAGAE